MTNSVSARVLIVGGSVGGLTAAIAFARASHRPIVFEAMSQVSPSMTGGCRLPPNVTKVLYEWGYERRLKEVGVGSSGIDLRLLDTGELLGRHIWEKQLISDAGGDFVFTTHSKFVQLLHDIALENDAELRYGCRVVSIDLKAKTVTLESGEIVQGDIIIGADGYEGVTRTLFDSDDENLETVYNVYSTTVPESKILADVVTADLYDPTQQALNAGWFGDGVAVLGWPAKDGDYALMVYGPVEGEPTGWLKQGTKDHMIRILGNAEPRLRKLLEWARDPQVVTVNKLSPLDDWYHPDGPVALIGHAAQPIVTGSVQEAATAFEDAVTLGRLFSHMHRLEQVTMLLDGYEEVRRSRDVKAYEKELQDLNYQTLPKHMAIFRDTAMKQKRDEGKMLFEISIPSEDGHFSDGWEEWQGMLDQFAYNAEHAADDWWLSTGRMADVSRGGDKPFFEVVIAQAVKETQGTISVF